MKGDLSAVQREEMIRYQIEHRGITDPRVIAAMRTVPRHLFFPQADSNIAYADAPAPIGFGQTISQPYIVALMTSLLETHPSDTVLEIGTGSGYQAAILSRMVDRVISLELIPQLAERARLTILALGYDNVEIICTDGSAGYADKQPYQGILVTACAPVTPRPLLEQLAEDSRLVLPVEAGDHQVLRIWEKDEDGILESFDHIPVAFVPLKGEFGYPNR